MKIYKIDQMRTGNDLAIIRLFEIEVVNFGDYKTSVTHSSKPIYLQIEMRTPTINHFHYAGQNRLYISFDLNEHFFQEKIKINDEYGDRNVEINVPCYTNMIFPTLRPGDELKIKNSDDIFEDNLDDDFHYEDEFSKLCPNCEDMYLEKYDTCEFCGYTRYK